MKTVVLLHLCILMSLVLLVRCGDEGDGGNEPVIGDGLSGGIAEEGIDGLSDGVADGDERYSLGDGINNDFGGTFTNTGPKLYFNYKCLVCRALLEEMKTQIDKVNPRKRIDVTATKSIQYTKSETYLTDLMETICEDDNSFSTIRLVVVQKTVIKEMHRNGGSFDYTPEDLNERLKHYCLEILEENDEEFLKHFMADVTPSNIQDIICTETAEYCGEDDVDDDEFEDNSRDEL